MCASLLMDEAGVPLVEESARSGERRAAFAARIGGLVSWEIDAETGAIVAESGLPGLFGLDPANPPANMGDYVASVHPADVESTMLEFDKARVVGGRYSAEFRVNLDGRTRWLRGCAEGVQVGNRLHIVGFNVDVTDEREQRERLDLINRELKHRMKNVLALVQALANQTFRSIGDEVLKTFEGRLRALGQSTDLLSHSEWKSVSVRALVELALEGSAGLDNRVTIGGPSIDVDPQAVLSLLLALHELATNAVKHGGLRAGGGGVSIAWEIKGDAVVLSWREVNSDVTAVKGQGFGSRLLRRVIEADLGGSYEGAVAPTGFNCEIRLPRRHFGRSN